MGNNKKIGGQAYSHALIALNKEGYIIFDGKSKIKRVTITEKTRNSTLTDDELKKALKESQLKSNNGEKRV